MAKETETLEARHQREREEEEAAQAGQVSAGGEDTHEDRPKTMKEILDAENKLQNEIDDVPIAALEDVDLGLPDEFLLDIMADELLSVISTYHRADSGWRSAKNIGDVPRQKNMWDLRNYAKVTAALIQHRYPDAKALSDSLALTQAKAKAKARAQIEEA